MYTEQTKEAISDERLVEMFAAGPIKEAELQLISQETEQRKK